MVEMWMIEHDLNLIWAGGCTIPQSQNSIAISATSTAAGLITGCAKLKPRYLEQHLLDSHTWRWRIPQELSNQILRNISKYFLRNSIISPQWFGISGCQSDQDESLAAAWVPCFLRRQHMQGSTARFTWPNSYGICGFHMKFCSFVL